MNAKEWRMAENLTNQISHKHLLHCPNCAYLSGTFEQGPLMPGRDRQQLCTVGDTQNQLFCPHCDLLVHLIVIDE